MAGIDLLDGTSTYWAYADNVLATAEMARIPLTYKQFKQLLNFQVLFSKHTVAPGICLLKNRHLKSLIEKEGYGLLFMERALVPLFYEGSVSFSEVESQDREDSTSYRVKQDTGLHDLAEELDLVCSDVLSLDLDEFRATLTERFERTFLSKEQLRRINLAAEKQNLRAYLHKARENSPTKILRRSTFFFLGDHLLNLRQSSGYLIKTKASANYHDTLAEQVGLKALLPDIYRPQAGFFAPNFRPVTLPDERVCFLSLRDLGRLSCNEVIMLRNSTAAKEYFQAGVTHLGAQTNESQNKLDEKFWRYALHVKESIATTTVTPSRAERTLSFIGTSISITQWTLPLAVLVAHLFEVGVVVLSAAAAGEVGLHYLGKHVEKKHNEIEQDTNMRKLAEWDARHRLEPPPKPSALI